MNDGNTMQALGKKTKRKPTVWGRVKRIVRQRVLSGLLVLVPLGITAFVVRFLYDWMSGFLAPAVQAYVRGIPERLVGALAIVLLLVLLYAIGLIANVFLGRRLIALTELVIEHIPMVKTIYGASKQVVESLSFQDHGANYEAAVVVDFPRPGMKAIAFMTGRIEVDDGRQLYKVFVVTTPNPTSGYFEIVEPEFIYQSNLSVEEAVRFVMSGGILAPETLEIAPLAAGALERTAAKRDNPAAPKATPKPKPLRVRIQQSIRNRMFSGLVVVVPVGITVFIVNLIYEFTAGFVAPLIRSMHGQLPNYVVAAVSVLLFACVLYLVGLVAAAVVGRRLIGLAEAILERIPLVKSVYGASKQVVGMVSLQDAGADLKSAVLVEFPSPGMKAVGFVMGKLRDSLGNTHYKVFIPTTPNVTVGLFQLVEPQDVFRCNLSVEDAVKMVVSAGILAPPRLRLTPMTQPAPETPPQEDENEIEEERTES